MSSGKRRLIVGAAALLLVGGAFLYAQAEIAGRSVRFDLHLIGASIYEAQSRHGAWPAGLEDLDGTEYLRMPYRKAMLEERRFVVVWHHDLSPEPAENANRVLAYDNHSLMSRFGWVLVCRGDLRVEYMGIEDLQDHLAGP